jgi:hypothetical protein
VITAACFPTPSLALRSNDPAEERRVHGFATKQATAAEQLRVRLAAEWPRCQTLPARGMLLRGAHTELVQWRYQEALAAPGRLGRGLPLDVKRFRTPIRDGGVNYDRIGDCGRLRAGAVWNAATRRFEGGQPTPASEIMAAYGRAALDRFERERDDTLGDVLFNIVRLPDGRLRTGNRILRGAAAAEVAARLVARIAARGGDTSQIETGGELLYVAGAEPDDADELWTAAIRVLANALELDSVGRLKAWQTARYLAYQAPRTKKGSDAVTRVFLVAVGAVLFRRPPVLEPDVDLRCMVLGQDAATVMPADKHIEGGVRY